MNLEGASVDDLSERFNILYADLAATPSSSERLEKLAGLLECVYGFAGINGTSLDEIEAIRLAKKKVRGSFIGGVVLLSCTPSNDLSRRSADSMW